MEFYSVDDIVKDWLIKDNQLIIHMGKKHIPQTKFFILNKSNAKDVRRLIDRFLKEE